MALLFPWLACTRQEDTKHRDVTQEASEESKLECASSACSHAGGVKVVVCTLLAERRSVGIEETSVTWMATFPPEDHIVASAAAAAAVLANVTAVEDRKAPPWHPTEEYAPQVLFDMISSRNAISVAGNWFSDCRTFSPSSTAISGGRSLVRT